MALDLYNGSRVLLCIFSYQVSFSPIDSVFIIFFFVAFIIKLFITFRIYEWDLDIPFNQKCIESSHRELDEILSGNVNVGLFSKKGMYIKADANFCRCYPLYDSLKSCCNQGHPSHSNQICKSTLCSITKSHASSFVGVQMRSTQILKRSTILRFHNLGNSSYIPAPLCSPWTSRCTELFSSKSKESCQLSKPIWSNGISIYQVSITKCLTRKKKAIMKTRFT